MHYVNPYWSLKITYKLHLKFKISKIYTHLLWIYWHYICSQANIVQAWKGGLMRIPALTLEFTIFQLGGTMDTLHFTGRSAHMIFSLLSPVYINEWGCITNDWRTRYRPGVPPPPQSLHIINEWFKLVKLFLFWICYNSLLENWRY